MDLLQEQIDYYRARAGEYDEWWLRHGRYDRGPEDNACWFSETAELDAALDAFRPAGRVLELACGTGLWSRNLARYANTLTLVDSSPEVLAINASRVEHPMVRHVQADLFDWRPHEQFDVVFFSFWLSHVPLDRFEAFWAMVQQCLAPNGRVFFIDSLYDERSTARDHQLHGPSATTIDRKLNDGRAYRIFKVFYRAGDLQQRLEQLGWRADVRRTDRYFLHGVARR
ncbi:MAG TPA: class I SAM-dependent methyltransferase [Chloroflexota bacterium]|jgi:demethylmenaquinone methyltransferase/2-methoxy-6-polyprenyl-1,4-benzoquinol methylase